MASTVKALTFDVFGTVVDWRGGIIRAHNADPAAAAALGCRTAFVPRPQEHGPAQTTDLRADRQWDVVAGDFGELAAALGC